MKLKTNILLLLLFLVVCHNVNAIDYYQRHYIILVDQTTLSMSEDPLGLQAIGEMLSNMFLNEETMKGVDSQKINDTETYLANLEFNPATDEISIFKFGIDSDKNDIYSQKYGLNRIRQQVRNGEDELSALTDELIIPVAQFQKSGEEISLFIRDHLTPLFSGTGFGGVNLTSIAYPCVLKKIDTAPPASEYYTIIVSNFKVRGEQENTDDYGLIRTAMDQSPTHATNFAKQLWQLNAPFYTSEFMRIQSLSSQSDLNNSMTRIKAIKAIGQRLGIKGLQGVTIYITSNIQLQQKELGSRKFKLSPVSIAFTHDDNLEVNKISLSVTDEDGNEIYKEDETDEETINQYFKAEEKKYEIPEHYITFDQSLSSGDEIKFKYVFHVTAKDQEGNDIMPFIYIADRDYKLLPENFKSPIKTNTMLIYLLGIVLFLALLAILIKRGQRKWMNLSIGSFAQKFMNVTDKEGAVELPCWFYHEGENAKSIRLCGTLQKKSFSIGGSTRLLVRLQDAKPEGFKYYIDRRNASDFIEVKTSGNKFSFNINIEMLPNIVDPSELSTCSVKIDFCIESNIMGMLKHRDVIDDVEDIRFYFLNDLGTAWVGFDPGTTGSCVSYGCTGGSLENPNIEMVTTDRDGGEEIIPSKLVLTKDFGDKSIEQLRPGTDYLYGREAEQNWDAYNRDGKPCFQSIKKLLGYKNSVDDMIEVNWGDKTRKLTGLQLAHLLVKGLKKELDENVQALSQTDAIRYVGKTGRARRAVVAIPNNYTLPKITDMVNSIRMLGSFDEVRYIYEAEGILFNYFRKNYRSQKPGQETIMVYDMGGATINLSIFRVEYIEKDGTIYYNVHTLGRIGYAVGGDNIDVAIMEHIFNHEKLPTTITPGMRQSNPQVAREHDKYRHEHQLKNKNDILKKIVALKKDIVKAVNAKVNGKSLNDNTLENAASFENTINDILNHYSALPVNAFDNIDPDDFTIKAIDTICCSEEMQDFVMSNVQDAVEESLKLPAIERLSRIDTLIFAGRSTMFPGIRDTVYNTIKRTYRGVQVYNGFTDEEIKTSVSYGACWYGIYNSLVTLDNSRLSCAYGFKLTQHGKSLLNVLLNQNDSFNERGEVSGSKSLSNRFDADGNVVDFYQVMGSGKGDDLFSENNRHKVSFIGSIDVTTTTSEIAMTADRRNVVTCKVVFNTGDTSVFKDLNVVGRDITKENDWAYVFAATQQTKSSEQPQADRPRPAQPQPQKTHSTNPADESAAVEEKTNFSVILKSAGPAKLQVVKAVKEAFDLGLKEAKEMVDDAPCVLIDMPKAKAEAMKEVLEEAGAIIELKPTNRPKGPVLRPINGSNRV